MSVVPGTSSGWPVFVVDLCGWAGDASDDVVGGPRPWNATDLGSPPNLSEEPAFDVSLEAHSSLGRTRRSAEGKEGGQEAEVIARVMG